MTTKLSILQCCDTHFGRDADLDQVAALEGLAADLGPTAIAVAGDLTQRARHGEFQRALVFIQALRRLAPQVVVKSYGLPHFIMGAPSAADRKAKTSGKRVMVTA